MPAVLPALVIGTMVAIAGACAEGADVEHGSDASTPSRVMRFAPVAPKPADTFGLDVRFDAGRGGALEASDDAGLDSDADSDPQASEYERAIVYDCTETVRCSDMPANNIPKCVVSVREALNAASAETRQVFLMNVRRCQPQRACNYVDCATREP